MEALPDLPLTPAMVQEMEALDVLVMGLGRQEILKQQLDIVKTFIGVRVRVATFNCNRALVLERGLEFYDIGSDFRSSAPRRAAETWSSASSRLSWAFFDNAHAQARGPPARPFVADVAMSDLPDKSSTHTLRSHTDHQVPQILLEPVSSLKEKDLDANDNLSSVLGKLKLRKQGGRCVLFRALTAHWRHPQTSMIVSGAAAAGLISSNTIRWSELELLPSATLHDEGPHCRTASWTFLVGHVYAFFLLLSRLLDGFGQEKFAKENRRCVRMRDPLCRSRMRQAWFDLELLKTHCSEDVEENISRMWEERVCHDG